MEYLKELGINDSELSILLNLPNKDTIKKLELFPKIVKTNYNYFKKIGIKNYKEIFINHSEMFLKNPDKFENIFDKYDQADLIRCLEKNGDIIEKL